MQPRPLTELTKYRKGHKPPMSMSALAKELGVKPATVSRWESGKRAPEHKHIKRIAALVGADAAKLAGF